MDGYQFQLILDQIKEGNQQRVFMIQQLGHIITLLENKEKKINLKDQSKKDNIENNESVDIITQGKRR